MVNQYVTQQDLQDAMNMAKARVFHYQQIGWTMFNKDELLSAANEGICEALIRFEPAKGTVKETKFTSYAYFWIEKYLKEFITKNKTMLSGSSYELWTGQVPYVNSIDAYDDSNNDTVGSDHKDWLGTDVLPSTALEASERQVRVQDLLAKIFLELEPTERLCIQLSLGIGTVNSVQLSVREIAKATRLTVVNVQACIDHAYDVMRQNKEKYIAIFEAL